MRYQGQETMDVNLMREDFLTRVAESNSHFKSQQIGEPDLTLADKKQIATDILDKSPSLFLYRFGNHLSKDDLCYFNQYRKDYDVDFYIKELEKQFNTDRDKVKIKNRRYEALKQLKEENKYFSDAEMKKRNPFLFEQMIGQYMTEDEREALEEIDKQDMRFTTILLDHIDRDQISSLRIQQQMAEEGIVEENDSDDEDDERYYYDNDRKEVSDEEKRQLRHEFVTSMQESFLLGQDKEFDYSTVDNNEAYDNYDHTIDEDKYFDSEEPGDISEGQEENIPTQMDET